MSLNVAVIGCGVAGAATALFLRRAGHHIAQFEQSARDTSEGAGLLLQPPALGVLRSAGLLEQLMSLGARVDHINAHFAATGQTGRLDYSEFDRDAFACGVHRATLIALLRSAAGCDENTHWATRVSSVNPQTGFLELDDGSQSGPYDLIVAADGTRSAIRAQFPALVEHDRAYDDAAVVCLVEGLDWLPTAGVSQHFQSGSHVSTWPVGSFQTGDNGRLAIATRVHSRDVSTYTGLEEWLRLLTRIHPALAERVRALPMMPTLLAYNYRDVATRQYHFQRLVLIGDAAHAMSPQLGLGASLGLLDAWVLWKFLGSHESIASALTVFDRARRRAVEPCQQMSRLVTPYFQSDNRVMATLRAHSTTLFGRSEYARRRALAVLCTVPPEMR